MSIYDNIFYKAYHAFVLQISKIHWREKKKITEEEKVEIAKLLASGYYIILTSDNSKLSSLIVKVLSFISTGEKPKYSHVLMNCDNIEDPNDRNSFKFLEATSAGVHYSTFDQVFDCDNVCLLTPKTIENEEWTKIIDNLVEQNGKPYDDLFNLSDTTHLSCVELVLGALKSIDYINHFAEFDTLIAKKGNLTPQMYRDCNDFKVKVEY